MRLARTLVPALLVGLLPLFAAAADEDASFIRWRDGAAGNGALEIAHATYKNDKTGVEVVLYGVVHIADPAYYKRVQKDLDSYDVVLYEGVGPTDKTKVDESMKALGEMQGMMGELLGLQFQKDGIDYKAKNLVHADMSQEELEKAAGGDMSRVLPMMKIFQDPKVAKQMVPLMRMMRTLGKGFMEGNPAMKNNLKSMMAKQMGNADFGSMPGGDEMMRVIIVERNKVALGVLDKELEKRKSGKIAIFYGAGHMPDMEKRLAEKGWRQTNKSWDAAWTVGGDEPSSSDDDDDDRPAKKPAKREEPKEEPRKALPAGKRWI